MCLIGSVAKRSGGSRSDWRLIVAHRLSILGSQIPSELGMEISIQSLLEGARRATGTVAVIDVFRAFTTAAVALANGASSIVMVSTVEEALALRGAGIGDICMGEVHGKPPPEFDFGNSPFEISAVVFT